MKSIFRVLIVLIQLVIIHNSFAAGTIQNGMKGSGAFTFPSTDGTVGQLMRTNGSAVLSFGTSLPPGYVNVKDYSASGLFTSTQINGAQACSGTNFLVDDSSSWVVNQDARIVGGGAASIDTVRNVSAIPDATHLTFGSALACTGNIADNAVIYHDDTQAFIDAEATGSKVYGPAGRYRVSQIAIGTITFNGAPGAWLIGEGSGDCSVSASSTCIYPMDLTGDALVFNDFYDGIFNVAIIQVGTPTAGTCLTMGNASTTKDNLIAHNIRILGCYYDWKSLIVNLSSFSNLIFTDAVYSALDVTTTSPYGDNFYTDIELNYSCSSDSCNSATGLWIHEADLSWYINVKALNYRHDLIINPGAGKYVYNQKFTGFGAEGGVQTTNEYMAEVKTTSTGIIHNVTFVSSSFGAGNTSHATYGLLAGTAGDNTTAVTVSSSTFTGAGATSLVIYGDHVTVKASQFQDAGTLTNNTYDFIILPDTGAADVIIDGNQFQDTGGNKAKYIIDCNAVNTPRLSFLGNTWNGAFGTSIQNCGAVTDFRTDIDNRSQDVSGTTVAPDIDLGGNVYLPMTGNTTFNDPTHPFCGAKLNILLKQDATGTRTTTWSGTAYVGEVNQTFGTANQYATYSFIYNCTAAKWQMLGYPTTFAN